MTDILVIGGGPAGSTAAALLAEQGQDVLLLEKSRHPRFHIGESLLPRNLALIDRLGLRDAVHAMGQFKPGAEFVDDDTGRSVSFSFANALDQTYTHSYQVRRDQFDALLFDTARRKGARTIEDIRVTAVEPAGEDGRVTVRAVGADGEEQVFRPRFVLDASGRDAVIASKLGTRVANKRNNTAAVYAHYRGVARRPGDREGYITIHLVREGWFWTIPLADGTMSIGLVGDASLFKRRRGTPAELLDEMIAASPTLLARMAGAERIGEVSSTGNYSYRARTNWGEGYQLIGDAFSFVDPIFSSGVLLAMTAGEMGAELATTWLADPAAGRRLARRQERLLVRGMDNLTWLIYRINDPVLRHLFMNPRNTFRMRDGLVSILAGNLKISGRARIPVLAFKTVYHVASLAARVAPLRVPRLIGQPSAVAPAE